MIQSIFSLDPNTGILTLKVQINGSSSYDFSVEASVGGESSSASVR